MPPLALGNRLGLQFVSQSGTEGQLILFIIMLDGHLLLLSDHLLTT